MKQALSILTILTTVFVLAPSAQACSSESSCKRTLKCMPGSSLKYSGSMHWCEKKASGGTVVPTCAKANLANDWKFSTSTGKCTRTKGKNTISLTSNITCKSGYDYKSTSKRCEKPATTHYYRPFLSPGSASSSDLLPSTSRTARDVSVSCPAGFTRKGSERSSGTWCEKSVSASTSTATPKCGSANGHSDWSFNAQKDQCCRTRKKGKKAEVCRSSNMTCSSGYTYDSGINKCKKVTTGGKTYAAPARKL